MAVTGAAAGIGRATARAFAARRATVVLIASQAGGPPTDAGLRQVAEEVRVAGGTPVVLPLDVGDPSAVGAAVDRIESQVGPIDVWVDAPVTPGPSDAPVSAAEHRQLDETGYLGVVYATKAVLEPMVARDRGTVVRVTPPASTAAGQPTALGAEQALEGFHGSLRDALVRRGSHVRLALVHEHDTEDTVRAVVGTASPR